MRTVRNIASGIGSLVSAHVFGKEVCAATFCFQFTFTVGFDFSGFGNGTAGFGAAGQGAEGQYRHYSENKNR